MKCLVLTSTLLLALLSFQSWSQSDQSKNINGFICEPAPLFNKSDSISNQISIDSIYNLINGRWRLLETHVDAFPSVRKPSMTTEIIIDSLGQTAVYSDGELSERFDIHVALHYGYFHFSTDEVGRRFFKFPNRTNERNHKSSQRPGVIRICQDILCIAGITSSGTQFFFRRQ